MQPVESADVTTVGPFAVYFPSGFKPSSDASCTWHVYTHKTHAHQHIIVARTVRVIARSLLHQKVNCLLLLVPAHCAGLAQDKVDFVGRTNGGEYAGHLPCR